MMSNREELQKLKSALNEYHQFIERRKREEQARIERERQEEQRRIEIARAEHERQMNEIKQFLTQHVAPFAVIAGIIAGIYFGWIYLVDFVLRCILMLVAVALSAGIITLGAITKMPDNIVVPLLLILTIVCIVMSYIPSSDLYRSVPIWGN